MHIAWTQHLSYYSLSYFCTALVAPDNQLNNPSQCFSGPVKLHNGKAATTPATFTITLRGSVHGETLELMCRDPLGVPWDGMAYLHRTGFGPVSDQCHVGCTNPCHSVFLIKT